MNILMILDNAFKPDLRVKKEINTLTALGFSIYLFCWDKDSELPEEIDDNFLKIRRVKVKTKTQQGINQIKKLLRFYYLLLKRIRKENKKFDYIYIHDFLMLPVGVYLKIKFKNILIYDAHEIYHIMEWEKYNSFIRSIIFKTEKFLLHFVDKFIVVSQVRKNFYEKYFNKKITILGNWFDPSTDEEINLRDKLKIPDDSLVFGYFGGLNRKVRCIDYIINSVLEIPNAHLLIAGTGHDIEYIEEYAKLNNRIHFLGWLEDIRRYINNADYILYFINADRKYFNYAAPNTLYLSISHGIPLVTNVPGEAELLIKSHKIGFFVSENEKLINKIELNIRSDYYKEIKKNIINIRNKYTWSASFNIYNEILNGNLPEG